MRNDRNVKRRKIVSTVRVFRLGEGPDDAVFWQRKSIRERLEALEVLRRQYIRLMYGTRPRLQRVYKKRRKTKTVGGVKVHIIGREDLIRNKRLVGRPRDLEDVKQLRKRKQ